MSSPLTIHLPLYEGPLDLLLDLIRKQQLKIEDIPIASITSQYLNYMQQAKDLDIELSADFVYMAATLIHIKSRMLLPKDPELEAIEAEGDPRQELVQRLIEHEKFKAAAEMLAQKRLLEEAVWSNPQIQMFIDEDDTPGLAVTLFDLVKTLQTVVERVKSRPVYEVDKEDVSVPDMILFLRDQLETRVGEAISVLGLFEKQRSQRARICLFLAMLELVKRQAIALAQTDLFGDIVVERRERYEEALNPGAAEMAAVAEEYK